MWAQCVILFLYPLPSSFHERTHRTFVDLAWSWRTCGLQIHGWRVASSSIGGAIASSIDGSALASTIHGGAAHAPRLTGESGSRTLDMLPWASSCIRDPRPERREARRGRPPAHSIGGGAASWTRMLACVLGRRWRGSPLAHSLAPRQRWRRQDARRGARPRSASCDTDGLTRTPPRARCSSTPARLLAPGDGEDKRKVVGKKADEWAPCVGECEREEKGGNFVYIVIYGALCTSKTRPKSSPGVYNGVSQTYEKFQWQWHSFANSNGTLQKW